MKTLITYAAFICSFFIACNSRTSKDKIQAKKGQDIKKISKRDLSITKANAYNDIFLDSLRLAHFSAKVNLPENITRRMTSFYNARNYQYAWFASNGFTEQTLGFWNLHNYATYSGDTSLNNSYLQKKMDGLLQDTGLVVNPVDSIMLSIELLLTQHFIEYSLSNYEKGFVKRKELERFIPIKKEDVMLLADSLLTHKHKDNKYFDDVNQPYKKLREQLKKYSLVAQKGGWQQVAGDAKQYKRGTVSPLIADLKKRFIMTGDLSFTDTSQVFTDTLEAAIKHFQHRLGYKPDGIITTVLLKDLNVPVLERIQQIMINMNRMRWMPQEPAGKLIMVNIPEFRLHFSEGKKNIFDMNVVVGKEGHNTMMFTGELSQVVFSPYWNVPSSIVKREILPKMARNRRYLSQQHMEITGHEGGLPRIRQLPGGKNSLGKVKFLFPNSFDIYFHDTPAKFLFTKDKRAYSHGCIRLSDPLKMAEYLLKDDTTWPREKIVEAMNAGKQKFAKIKEPVPVFITYYTAWVDENNQLNFRDDIYRRDLAVAGKMFR